MKLFRSKFMLVLFVYFMSSLNTYAAKPVPDKIHSFPSAPYTWKYTFDKALHTLDIYFNNTKKTATYSLDCNLFCQGNEDNCNKDGIFEIVLQSKPKEYLIGVGCHFGAHSQRFMIFDPLKNQNKPVESVTGSYFIDYNIQPQGIKILYDEPDGNDFKTHEKYWPSRAAWSNNLVERAHLLYEDGKREQAFELYLQAAAEGDADGHFYAAYQYALPNEEATFHFVKAAEQGHEKALKYALNNLFFRANSLTAADPQKALNLYYQAKKKNVDLTVYGENKTMQRCVEAGLLDTSRFVKEHEQFLEQSPDEADNFYSIWQMAEYAANTTRFGKPDTRLALQLVCRGGWVPAEVEYAVEELHQAWKAGVAPHFNLCDHVTSGYGARFCQRRLKETNR